MSSSPRLFSYYARFTRVFVETGTYMGDGIQRAIDSGYKTVYSCDVNRDLVDQAARRFAGANVHVALGASGDVLPGILSQIDERAVFFLDGHAMPPDPTSKHFSPSTLVPGREDDPSAYAPLRDELELILAHSVKDHIILIDDRQCFGTWMFNGLTESEICHAVVSSEPEYEFHYFENVLVCAPGDLGAPSEPVSVKLRSAVARATRYVRRK